MKQTTISGQELPKFKENSWLKQWDVEKHTPEAIVQKAIELFTVKNKRKPDETPKFWVASSGGNDSMVVADIVDKMGLLEGIFHIHIYGAVQQTFDFIKNTCNEKGWRLEIREPKPKYIMVSLVLETGFPSYYLHPMYMNELKRETLERFVKEKNIRAGNPVIVTGIRKFESERRFGNYEFPIQMDDAKIRYVCPIFYWKDVEKYEYTIFNKIKASPTKQKLGHSGECPCSSFAHPHEAVEWNQLDPDSAHFIKWLEYGVEHFGTETARKHSKWGVKE